MNRITVFEGLGSVVSRTATALVVALAFLFASGAADAHYSSIVIDGPTGKVLAEHDPDSINYPASLTKMMTLYLAFEALEHGKIHLDQRFTVSRHAAAQVPSNLGLEAGQTISVHELILAIVTHSANDAAVVLAEGLGGSEPAFAQMMTAKAHQLGMANTLFHNASGLPANPQNTTTARDLVTLARALYRRFPQDYGYFSTEEFTYNGHEYANHNHLMHSFEGMDGLKTGFINASGFNLAASAVRNNHRLFAVILGGTSAHARDLKMAALLNATFARVENGGTMVAVEDTPPGGTQDGLAHRAKRALAALSPVAHAEAATRTSAVHARREHAAAGPGWTIQVGAFAQHVAAERAGTQALAKLPGSLKGRTVQILRPSRSDKVHLYRARIAHFSERDAKLACRALHRQHRDCAVIAPEATHVASR